MAPKADLLHWRLRQNYLPHGFLVQTAKTSRYDHWQGGPAYHQGAECPGCKRPLLLLWDFNCQDPRLNKKPFPGFGRLKRLPLYFCWHCCIDLSYRVVSPKRIEIIEFEAHKNPVDFPYPNYPEFYERKPIVLKRIPYEMEKLLILLNDADDDFLKRNELKTLADWKGIEWRGPPENPPDASDFWRHQLGGHLYLQQGHESYGCPNEKCCESKGAFDSFYLTDLATIHNDPASGLPMIDRVEDITSTGVADFWTQVIYKICPNCFTIKTYERCS